MSKNVVVILIIFCQFLISCSSGGEDLSLNLPTLSVTCKSSDVDTCTTTNSSRLVYMGLKPRFDGFTCNEIYSMYPTNYNNYFEYHIDFQVFTHTDGLFAQGLDWEDKNFQSATQATPDQEYTLCGFIDFNSDSMLSTGEAIYSNNFEFNFDPYTVDEWSKNQ